MQKENDVKQNENVITATVFCDLRDSQNADLRKNTITAASKAEKKMPKRIIEAFEGCEK